MKKAISSHTILLVLVSFISFTLMAQKGIEDGSKFGHGEDSINCIKFLSLYREYAKQEDFSSALPFWRIPFNECPVSNKNIYIDGVKIFRYLIDNEQDKNIQSAYIDTLMLIYDQRIKYYPKDLGNVRGRQGVDLLRYRRTEDIKYVDQAYGYLAKSIDELKNRSSNATLATFISASLTLYQQNMIDAGQVINDYLLVSNILDGKINTRPNPRLESMKETIDANFVKEGPGDCDTLISFLSEATKTREEDIDFLKMLTSLLRNKECTGSDLFFNSSIQLHKLEPSAESAVNIALMAFTRGNYSESAEFYKQAIELETDDTKKSEDYFGLAAAYSKLEKYSEARDYARKSISLNEKWGEPYLLIGQMYAESKNICSGISLPNSVYWLAVDYFKIAKEKDPSITEKANNRIITYSKYYPNKEEAFFHGLHEGNPYKINCWINESTTARFNE